MEWEQNEQVAYFFDPITTAILSEKRQMAEERNVAFDAYAEPYLKVNQIGEADMVTILGRLLDNAIEAAEKSPDNRRVWVRIFMENERRILVIKVVSPFIGEASDKQIFLSTKRELKQLGTNIKSVNKVTKKYGFLGCFIEKDVFTASALLFVK